MRLPSRYRLLFAAAAIALPGCYNGDALVDQARNDALKHRLEEVDLGVYRVTMPSNPSTTETVEVEMHLFGSLPRYRQSEVEQRLEEREFQLRHETLLAIRQSSSDDFVDPDLTRLRERILTTTNGLLDEPTIQSVGFHDIRFIRN